LSSQWSQRRNPAASVGRRLIGGDWCYAAKGLVEDADPVCKECTEKLQKHCMPIEGRKAHHMSKGERKKKCANK
jgi:hypothetical protein